MRLATSTSDLIDWMLRKPASYWIWPDVLGCNCDAGLSDNHLLEWSVDAHTTHLPPLSRLPFQLNIELLRSSLWLCYSNYVTAMSSIHADATAVFSDNTVTSILDQMVPTHHLVRLPWLTDPWFDSKCRDAKKLIRQLRQFSSRPRRHHILFTRRDASIMRQYDIVFPETAWRDQCCDPLNRKCNSYCRAGSRLTVSHWNDALHLICWCAISSASSSNPLLVRPPRLVTVDDCAFVHFRSQALTCGTVFLTNSLHCSLNFPSGVNSRNFYFVHHTLTSVAKRFNHNRSI